MSKRTRVVLSLEDKVKIIDRLNKGENPTALANEFNIGKTTIYDLKKNANSILYFTSDMDSESGPSRRKVMKKPKNIELDEAVYAWFLQKRSLGEHLSGPLICEKAMEFHNKLNGDKNFKASSGWLKNFKSRHGIRELDIQGERLSVNESASSSFRYEFYKIVKEYDRQNVYNMDETGLLWKALPRKTLASKREISTPEGFKLRNERLTIALCSNAAGTHRLPTLVIGNSINPKSFQNVTDLPVVYRSQKSAWMNIDIFIDWYVNVFIPEVKKHQDSLGIKGNVLLVLDKAPTHPNETVINSFNENFKVCFLPPNVTSLIQPLGQGITETFKRFYRKRLLRRLILSDEDEEGIVALYKSLNILDSAYMIRDAWNDISAHTLSHGWSKILRQPSSEESNKLTSLAENLSQSLSVEELVDMLKEVPGCQECDVEDVTDWLSFDANDQGFQILSEEEIVSSLTVEETTEDDEEIERQSKNETKWPSHSDACVALETAIKWAEREGIAQSIILLLRNLKNDAAQKTSKQNNKTKTM